jgi:hypothetical protein
MCLCRTGAASNQVGQAAELLLGQQRAIQRRVQRTDRLEPSSAQDHIGESAGNRRGRDAVHPRAVGRSERELMHDGETVGALVAGQRLGHGHVDPVGRAQSGDAEELCGGVQDRARVRPGCGDSGPDTGRPVDRAGGDEVVPAGHPPPPAGPAQAPDLVAAEPSGQRLVRPYQAALLGRDAVSPDSIDPRPEPAASMVIPGDPCG